MKITNEREVIGTTLFVCPFHKISPLKYTDCASFTCTKVSELIDHFRVLQRHRLPYFCPACHEVFKWQKLRDQHIIQRLCARIPGEFQWHGVDVSAWQDFVDDFEELETAEETLSAIYAQLLPGLHPHSWSSNYRSPTVEDDELL